MTERTREEFAADILRGLSSSPKKLSSKYFYDERGSGLFAEIMRLEEYYLSGCEAEILTANGAELSGRLPRREFNLIELGAGDGSKTRILIERLLSDGHRFEYLPIDISRAAVRELDGAFRKLFPGLRLTGLVADYQRGLEWILRRRPGRNVVLFLGSNIGNFPRDEAASFLRALASTLRGGDDLLIGFDLKKDIETMRRAYNDSRGLTREFNLNLLRRINRELNADFDPAKFQHYGVYNPVLGAMESYLISLETQTVGVGALRRGFTFSAYEPVHMECSNKYLVEEVEKIAADCGFEVIRHYLDTRKYFLDSLWRVSE